MWYHYDTPHSISLASPRCHRYAALRVVPGVKYISSGVR